MRAARILQAVVVGIVTPVVALGLVVPGLRSHHVTSAAPTDLRQPGPASPPLTPGQRELVDWVRSRFSLVGLDLPDVEISFHDDTEPCRGSDGMYERDSDGARVVVCVRDRGTFASRLHRQRTLVHELAHAWEQANLGENERTALLDTLGANGWYAPGDPWERRGAERFAETIVWGLYDQLRRPTLIDVPCAELHADFVAITGVPAPGPLEPICALESAHRPPRAPANEGDQQ